MSSDTMTATNDQWMQFYQQPLMDGAMVQPKEGLISDATVMRKSPTMPSEGKLSPTSSYTTTSGQLIPKANVFKPIRRSRASKRTPTTLLNANTTNFRALVQQFTGCPSTTMSLPGVHKGPITLNFKQGSKQQGQHETTRIMPQIGSTSHNYQVHHQVAVPLPWQRQQELLLHQQQQLFQEQQQGGYSFDYMKSSNILPTLLGTSDPPSMEVSDGLLVGNDFSFHDLTVNAFSNDAY